MRTIVFLFAATLILSVAASCNQKSEKATKQESEKPADSAAQKTEDTTQPKPAEAIQQQPAATTTPQESTASATTIWQRIQTYVNTSPKKDGPVPNEIMATMGKDWHYTVTQLWFMVQFNIKKKLSRGVTGLTEANFDDKYDEQYDIAIRGGY